jgi:hypothetical protein
MANSFNTLPVWLDTDTSTGGNTNWRGSSGCTLSGIGKLGIKPYKILITPAVAAAAVVTGTISVQDPQTNPPTQGLLTVPIVTPAATEPFAPIELDLSNASPLWRDFVVTGLTATKCALQIWYRA